eukprot:3264027-Ditylum_brightwellii.AAC.1
MTVEGNRKMPTRKEYEKAVAAQKLYALVGQSSVANFNNMVKLNLLLGFPVSLQDVTSAEFLFGMDLGTLKGETVCKTPLSIRTDHINVPQKLIDLHKHVTIAVGV